MGKCLNCGREGLLISTFIGLCRDCILHDFRQVEERIENIHKISRRFFGLPPSPPKEKGGLPCRLCSNECRIPKGEYGYCGIRKNIEGKRLSPKSNQAFCSWYHDPLPTNCVADWVCAGGTGAGYPRFSYADGPEYGYQNLAVFYFGCSFNCLFCQNLSHKKGSHFSKGLSPFELVKAVDEKTSCICYFGGDPSPQLPHSIKTSRLALSLKRARILRVCWETNGTMNINLLEEILEIALESGGCVKFDLKAFNQSLNFALTGGDNERTKENFELAAKWTRKRREPPLVVASTLLVPGYVERDEVSLISKFISSLDPEIPYSLLGFHPHFAMHDLPRTSRNHAHECREVALQAGLKRVKIGNVHLLGREY